MFKNGVEQKPSETALFAAIYRAIANTDNRNEVLGSDYLAENFLPGLLKYLMKFKIIRGNIKNKGHKLAPGIYEYVLARTAFFDNVFRDALNNQISQIVLLGAGYDTRPYRFTNLNNSTRIFELEISPTQNRKKKCLVKAKIDIPENVTFVPIDFNKETLQNVLEKAGYNKNENTLFVWEGVSYYLEPTSVDATLEFIKNYSPKESLIAFDYAVPLSDETIDNYYGAKEFASTWKKHHSNEPFKFAINEDEIELFLGKRGLGVVDYLDNEQIEKTFLSKENGSLIGNVPGFFRFVVASPDE